MSAILFNLYMYLHYILLQAITAHKKEQGKLIFQVSWSDGSTTWEPRRMFKPKDIDVYLLGLHAPAPVAVPPTIPPLPSLATSKGKRKSSRNPPPSSKDQRAPARRRLTKGASLGPDRAALPVAEETVPPVSKEEGGANVVADDDEDDRLIASMFDSFDDTEDMNEQDEEDQDKDEEEEDYDLEGEEEEDE
jgi:hypothetical protein